MICDIFDLVIFENIYGSVNFNADRLENLFFNPLLKTFLFAVDTSLFYSHKDPNQLIRVMNCELSSYGETPPYGHLGNTVNSLSWPLFLAAWQKPTYIFF